MLRQFCYITFSIFILFNSFNGFTQERFRMLNSKSKQVIPFKLLSNLIVFPIEVNGNDLNFILDSGVGATILFNLNSQDSIQLKNAKKIRLKGLGMEDAIEAILSTGNHFKINNIISENQKLYVVSNDNFDLSSKMGVTIHGIIGYEILKDFVVKINYNTKKIIFYNPNNYVREDCNKCETFDLEFHRLKPYINIGVRFNEDANNLVPVKMLIDSGGSDAMWLFENSKPEILPPTLFFRDFLGEGLSGEIYGKRSKIYSLVLGKFELLNPTVSYPDSLSVAQALSFTERNGSIGGTVLKRFTVMFDYRKSKITLKQGNYFKEPFRYNMSGIELVYNGKILVKELDKGAISYSDANISSNNKITLDYSYKFTFKPTYKIHNITVGSPAYEAGLQKGDIVIKINGKYTYDLKLEEIVEKFYQKENTKIELVVERGGRDYQYTFRLKDVLN